MFLVGVGDPARLVFDLVADHDVVLLIRFFTIVERKGFLIFHYFYEKH